MAVIDSHDGEGKAPEVKVLDCSPPARLPGAAAAPPATLVTRLVACLQYGFVSVAITLFNRAVFSVYHFNYPSVVTLIQILVSLAFMYALRAAGQMEFGALEAAQARKARRSAAGLQ